MIQLQESKPSETSLQEKTVKEKQKYSDPLSKCEELQGSKPSGASLQEKTVKEKQENSDLYGGSEEQLSLLPLVGEGPPTESTNPNKVYN